MPYPPKGRADFLALGDWNAACAECGRKRKASDMRQLPPGVPGGGMYVCYPEHWNPRQQQDFVRGVPDKMAAPWAQNQNDTYSLCVVNVEVDETEITVACSAQCSNTIVAVPAGAVVNVIIQGVCAVQINVGGVVTVENPDGADVTIVDLGGSFTLAPPTTLTAVTSGFGINTAWVLADGVQDGFKLERKLTVGGTFEEVADIGRTVFAYSDTPLETDTGYTYRVRAYKTVNGALVYSAYSNEASATTLPVDPDWASVVLLMHMDEPDYEVDEAGHTVTLGAGTLDGTATGGVFSGFMAFVRTEGVNNPYWEIAASDDFNVTGQDFTIEWAQKYVTGTNLFNQNCMMFGLSTGLNAAMEFGRARLMFGAVMILDDNTSGGLTANQWYRFAITREGTTFRIFRDGALKNTVVSASEPAVTTGVFDIGPGSSLGSTNENVNLDEIRITIGVARYTAAYTLATEPFPNQ